MKIKTIRTKQLRLCQRASKLNAAIQPQQKHQMMFDMPVLKLIVTYEDADEFCAISNLSIVRALCHAPSKDQIKLIVISRDEELERSITLFSEVQERLFTVNHDIKYRKKMYKSLNELRKTDIETFSFYFPHLTTAKEIKNVLKLSNNQVKPPRIPATALMKENKKLSI